jgi:hypothetical protein
MPEQRAAPLRELKPVAFRRQKRQAGRGLPELKWLLAFAAAPALLPVFRNWNNRLCYQAVWLRSDSRTCTLSLFVVDCCEENYCIYFKIAMREFAEACTKRLLVHCSLIVLLRNSAE